MIAFIGQVSNWFWIGTLLSLLALVLSVVWYVNSTSFYNDGWPIAAIFASALILIFVSLGLVITGLSRHYGRIGCSNFGAQSGYKTKFRILQSGDTGTCLVQLPGGRWIPKSQIRDYSGR